MQDAVGTRARLSGPELLCTGPPRWNRVGAVEFRPLAGPDSYAPTSIGPVFLCTTVRIGDGRPERGGGTRSTDRACGGVAAGGTPGRGDRPAAAAVSSCPRRWRR